VANLVFDFGNFDAKGLKHIASAFGRSKAPVIKDEKGNPNIAGTNRVTRVKGLPTKSATFYFVDGQSLKLSATSEGAIYQVKLNSTFIPVKNKGNLQAAIKEIAQLIRKNSKVFSERLAKRTVKKHLAEVMDKPGSNSIPAKMKAAKEQMLGLQESLDVSREEAETKNQRLISITSRIVALESSISDERAKNQRLKTQLAELKQAA